MIIKDPEMLKKMEQALEQAGGIYTLDDIGHALKSGDMQSHTEKGTWIITQVHDFPNKRIVDIVYVVGDLEGAYAADQTIEKWAVNLGADRITATGRDGWERLPSVGWKKVGTLYAKELDHGR